MASNLSVDLERRVSKDLAESKIHSDKTVEWFLKLCTDEGPNEELSIGSLPDNAGSLFPAVHVKALVQFFCFFHPQGP